MVAAWQVRSTFDSERLRRGRKSVRECPSTVLGTVPRCESAYFGGLLVGKPIEKAKASKHFLRGISLSEYGSELF